MVLSIKFKDGDITQNEKEISAPEYIPNIGDSIYNDKDGVGDYKVTRKDCFYNYGGTHVVIMATKKY